MFGEILNHRKEGTPRIFTLCYAVTRADLSTLPSRKSTLPTTFAYSALLSFTFIYFQKLLQSCNCPFTYSGDGLSHYFLTLIDNYLKILISQEAN